MNIGEKLKELRIQRNLTQEELADRCELSKGFISQVERDLASPSIATLTDMLECLGSSLKEFFSDDSAEGLQLLPAPQYDPLSGKHRRSPRRHSLDLYSAKLLSLSLLKELYRHDGTGTPH